MRLHVLAALTTLALGAATPLVVASSASAADPTCQGRAATIASDAAVVTGTAGDDVISVGQATTRVSGLDGDDLVCSVAGTVVDAGAGADSVVASDRTPASSALITTITLGPGDDSYRGTAGIDVVDAGAGRDSVVTLGGADVLTSGVPGEPNLDSADLGDGDDRIDAVLPVGSSAVLTSGPGAGNEVSISGGTPGGAWVAELGLGAVTRDGVRVATIADAQVLRSYLVDATSQTLHGNGSDNLVEVYGATPRLDVATLGGDDTVVLTGAKRAARDARGTLDLGGQPGDALQVSDRRRVKADLDRGRLVLDTRARARYALAGVRDVSATAADVRVEGDQRANTLLAAGCRVTMTGGPGRDVLATTAGLGDDAFFTCRGQEEQQGRHASTLRATGAVLRGDGGADRLDGNNRPDTLLGGPGADRADGRGGRDRCVAERTRRCER